MPTKAIKRRCPRCGNAVHVVKSIVATSSNNITTRLQNIKCVSCGLSGTIDVTEKLVWHFPAQ